MRILYLLNCPANVIGGSVKVAVALARGLQLDHGATVLVATPPSQDDNLPTPDGIDIAPCIGSRNSLSPPYRDPIGFMTARRDLGALLNSYSPDVVHSHGELSMLLYASLPQRPNVARVHTDHSTYRGFRMPMRVLQTAALRQMDALIVTTPINAYQWTGHFQGRITVIPNAVDPEFGPFLEADRVTARKDAGIPDGLLMLGFAGRMVPTKNWPVALAIVQRLHSMGYVFGVAVALITTPSSASEASELEGQLKSIGLPVCLLYRNLPTTEMPAFYYTIDIFAVPSLLESFGCTAIEAMSRGCCVVPSSNGGVSWVVGDEDLTAEPQVDQFVQRIRWLFDNKEILDRKRSELRLRCEQQFSFSTVLDSHFSLYESVLGSRS